MIKMGVAGEVVASLGFAMQLGRGVDLGRLGGFGKIRRGL